MGMVAWNCMNNRILIVEDDEDIAELIRFHLQKQGYATEIAMDGKTALEQFDAARPALILLDVMLPVIDGLEVLKAIRYDRHSTVPIIIESARGEETDIVTGLELGIRCNLFVGEGAIYNVNKIHFFLVFSGNVTFIFTQRQRLLFVFRAAKIELFSELYNYFHKSFRFVVNLFGYSFSCSHFSQI